MCSRGADHRAPVSCLLHTTALRVACAALRIVLLSAFGNAR
jgi:hypothetical protein